MATLASVIQRGLYSALPSAGIAGRLYFCSDSSGTYEGAIFYDDGTNWDGPYGGSGGGGGASFEVNGTPLSSATTVNFENGSNVTITNPSAGNVQIAASGGGGSLPPWLNFTAPPTSGWTKDNASGMTVNTGSPFLNLVIPPPSVGSSQLSIYYKTAPSTPYKATFAFLWDGSSMPPGSANSYPATASGLSFGFRDGSGKIVEWVLNYNGTSGVQDIEWQVNHWTSSTSYSSTPKTYNPGQGMQLMWYRQPIWLQIEDDGTNTNFYWSIDGLNFLQFYSESRTAWFASGPTQVYFGAQANQSQVVVTLASYAETA